MNLQEQGYRYIYRRSAHPHCGIWIRPEFVKPDDIDCTEWTDDEFADFLAREDWEDAKERLE